MAQEEEEHTVLLLLTYVDIVYIDICISIYTYRHNTHTDYLICYTVGACPEGRRGKLLTLGALETQRIAQEIIYQGRHVTFNVRRGLQQGHQVQPPGT